ncbi:globin-like [Haemaphysalis longicornis]
MGNCLSEHMDPRRWFSGGGPRDATGLTAAEKKAVRDVWKMHYRDHVEDYGVCVLQAFFLKYPDYLNLFKEFQGKTLRTLISDAKFREHCTRVGDELTALLGALDTPTELLQMMEQNAVRHCRMAGVEPAHFRQFGQVIVDMLCASYEDHMPPTALSGWQHFFERSELLEKRRNPRDLK